MTLLVPFCIEIKYLLLIPPVKGVLPSVEGFCEFIYEWEICVCLDCASIFNDRNLIKIILNITQIGLCKDGIIPILACLSVN